MSRYLKTKIYSTILETSMILFGVKDVMAILNKKYLIVIQSKHIAEKYKEKLKWFILKNWGKK